LAVKYYSIPSIEDLSGNLFYLNKASIPEVRPDVKRRKYEGSQRLFIYQPFNKMLSAKAIHPGPMSGPGWIFEVSASAVFP
jgi:hypothetical protein